MAEPGHGKWLRDARYGRTRWRRSAENCAADRVQHLIQRRGRPKRSLTVGKTAPTRITRSVSAFSLPPRVNETLPDRNDLDGRFKVEKKLSVGIKGECVRRRIGFLGIGGIVEMVIGSVL